MRTVLRGALVLGLAAGASARCLVALAQSTLETAAERQRAFVAQIEEEEARNGLQSQGLIEPLSALAAFYEEQGDPALAAATIERARQLIHIHYGLYSLDEAPLLRRLIRSAETAGDVESAWNLEQELLGLIARHPDDLETVPLLHEIGDKRMRMLERYLDGEYPAEIELGCYYEKTEAYGLWVPGIRRCQAGSQSTAVRAILTEAWSHYTAAVNVLLTHGLLGSAELRELEMQLVRSCYAHERYGFGLGRVSLLRLVSYAFATAEPWPTRAESLVEVADWDVLYANAINLFTSYEPVAAIYERTYALLEEHGIAPEVIEAIFAPEMPVVLPAFLPNPLAAAQTHQSTGSIDVTFDITNHGKADKIEVLGRTAGVSRAAERALVRLIKRSTFRPRVIDGRVADAAPVAVRYYTNESADE